MEFLPNEVQNIIKEFTIYKPKTKEELKAAVDLWCENKEKAFTKYGDISNWNTSLINNMTLLFLNKNFFNDNINLWDVSSVTDMGGIFYGASSFNQDISQWNVSKVKNMNSMFKGASLFNQDISQWNVSNVTDMSGMFGGASSLKMKPKWYKG